MCVCSLISSQFQLLKLHGMIMKSCLTDLELNAESILHEKIILTMRQTTRRVNKLRNTPRNSLVNKK